MKYKVLGTQYSGMFKIITVNDHQCGKYENLNLIMKRGEKILLDNRVSWIILQWIWIGLESTTNK